MHWQWAYSRFMSERQERLFATDFTLRPEYSDTRGASMHEPAFEAFDDLIAYAATYDGVASSYDSGAGVFRRELGIYSVDDGKSEEEEILFSDFSKVKLQREPSVSEFMLSVEDYKTGPLRRMARLTLKEYLSVSQYPFVQEYQIEAYAGGGTQAIVSTSDVLNGEGVDERRMASYDFNHLLKAIEQGAEFIGQAGAQSRVGKGARG